MLGWFKMLMPKEERFFDLFVRHAGIVVAGAQALRGVLEGGDQIEHYCQQILEHETKADEITREVLVAVRRTFITPFDRTDIQDLISRMDDAIDQMNKTAKTILLFEVRSFEPQMQQMGEIILKAAGLVLEAMPLLSSIGENAGRLNVLTEEIIRIEEQADELHAQGRKALFLANRDRQQCHALHHRQRDLRPPRESRRPARGRLQRDQCARHRSRIGDDRRWTRRLALPVLIGLIIVALAFDFLNGLHDAANSIATIVSTRVLRPRYAVMWAAFFNFIAFLFFGLHVAQTVGVGIVAAEVVDARVIFGALMGAISWNLITWWAGIPSSSSHALIGGLVGAGITKAGAGAVVWAGVLKTAAAIVLSPLTGFFLALLLVLPVSWLFVRALPALGRQAFPLRCSSSRRRFIRSATAATMPRRPWASSRCCCSRRGTSAANSMCRSGW